MLHIAASERIQDALNGIAIGLLFISAVAFCFGMVPWLLAIFLVSTALAAAVASVVQMERLPRNATRWQVRRVGIWWFFTQVALLGSIAMLDNFVGDAVWALMLIPAASIVVFRAEPN